MVAVEVSNEDFLNLTELNMWGGRAETLELMLGTFADIDEEGGGGGKDDGKGGLVTGGGGDCR